MNNAQKTSNRKLAIFIFVGFLLLAFFVFYYGIFPPSPAKDIKIDGIFLPRSQEIGDFNLTDNHSHPFNKDSLKGHWTMMFFGFTNCGMVCPTTLDALNKMYQMMQKELPADQMPQIAFISVDPDRDTVQKINEYVTAFNPHFMGARAGIAETIALEKQMHIVAAKMQVDGEGSDHYTINHSAEILLINPQAKLQAYFSFPHEPVQMLKDYKLILSTVKG